MVDGLKETTTYGQRVSMGTFGRANSVGVCFGCAATWTIQKLAGRKLVAEEVSALPYALSNPVTLDGLPWSVSDINMFEHAMDDARMGDLRRLFIFLGVSRRLEEEFVCRFCLTNETWANELPEVEKLIARLEAHDL